MIRLFYEIGDAGLLVKAMPTKRAIALLTSKGWVLVRTRGSHSVWKSPRGRQFTLPDRHREISPGVVRHLLNALEETDE